MTSAPAIGFEYRPSRGFRGLLMIVAAMAALALTLCALALWLKLLSLALVVLATWWTVRRMARTPVVAAGWGSDDSWTVRLADHEDLPATLLSFRVLGVFVLLRLRTAGQGVQVLLLAPDNSDADIRRRLRMRLAARQLDEAVPRI